MESRKWLTGIMLGLIALALLFVSASSLPVRAATTETDQTATQETSTDNNPEAPAGETLVLSLQQALDLALRANPQVELNRLSIAKADLALAQARNAADFDADYIVSYDMAKFKYLVPRQAEMQLKLAQAGAELQEKLLQLTVEKDYYNLLLAHAKLTNNQSNLERAQEQLGLAEASFQAGTVAKVDVLGAQVGVARGQAAVSAAQATYQQAVMRLNKDLGRPLEAPLELTDELEFIAHQVNMEQALQEAQAADIGILTAQEQVAVHKLDFDQVKRFYTPNVYAYRQVEYELEEAGVSLLQAQVDLELQVRSAQLNLQTAAKGHRVLDESLAAAREVYRVAKLKYEAGVGTAIEMRKAGDDLQHMETQQLEALTNYNLAWAQFKYNIFGGAGSGANQMQGAGGMPQ